MRNFTFKSALLKKITALFGILFLATSQISAQYCTATNTTNTAYYIASVVTTGGLSNISNSSGFTATGYADYTSQFVRQTPGNSFSITATGSTGSTYVWAIYCDWNNDMDFADPGETVYTYGSYVNAITTTITIPAGTTPGDIRMRVRTSWLTPVPAACGNVSYTETEDYTVRVQALVACNVATFPASATSTASPSTLCVSGNVTLSMTPVSAMPAASGVTYKWQTSPTLAGTYTDIPGSTSANSTYTTTTPITATAYFRCVVLCNGTSTVLTSTPTQVVVNNPGNPTVTGATRCGPGSLTLTATPPAGSGINWYTAPTGGSPIATGSTYTTPVIPTTTTYYASASSGSSPANAWIGTGTTVSSQPSPIYTLYYAQRSQFIITAAEMVAAGFGAGTINSIAIDVVANAGPALTGFTIKMGTTSLNAITSLQPSPATQVYTTASYMPVANSVNTFVFPAPFTWDGVSNLLIETCFNNNTWYTGHTVRTSTTSYSSSFVVYDDVSTFCANPTTGYSGSYSSRPNFRFDMTLGCNGPRQPVVATITPGPAINIAKPSVVCAGEIANIVVTSSPMSNYTNYTWTPNVADLYTNAAATTPYISGSAPNAYFRSNENGAHPYYLFSSGATPAACTHADTISIWVQPDSVSIKAVPDSICVTGTTTLSLLPATGYAPNSVQWQESTNGGATYTDIMGATNPTYGTPILSANRHYRILIKSTNDTCEMPTKQVTVVNPQLLGVSDSFNCGPGTVTLNAQTGGNATAKWYDAPTGGSSIGVGAPWVTPSLNASQTYYVSAEGSSSTNIWQVGTGTASYGGASYSPGPFSIYYRRYSQQYLYTAADMVAAGATPGQITYVQFNCTSLPAYAIPNYTIKVKFVPSTMTTLTWQTGLTQVYNFPGAFMPTVGWNNFPLSTPVVWNGTDGIVFEICHDQVQPTFTSSGNHQYTTKTGRFLSNNSDATGSSCGVTGTSTSTYLPNVKMGRPPCETPRMPVQAYIYPKPAVDLGQDINMCVDAGASIVLDAGYQPNTPTFLWDNTTSSQVRAVSNSGTYYVTVTNQYTCVGSDTINVLLRKNPVVDLGNDTTVCNGVVLTLNPGGGSIEYFWNTGQTGQTIDVNSAGTYSVFVTNAEGCISMDTIQVLMQGELPDIQGIQVSNDGQRTFHFTAVYPQNVIGYDWDFGDGSLHSYEASPVHTYDSVGDYIVVLHLSSTCGFANDTVGAHIVGIRQLNVNNDELTVYPNPSNGQATILNKGDLKMEKIEVYNILGQVVYRSQADSKDKHVINLSNIASGIYTIEVYTDKGTIARKLEILK